MRNLLVFLLILFSFGVAKSADSLHFTFPTTDAKFIAGSDTLITWEGIEPTDSVSIEYSIDNGNTWLMLSKKVYGLQYTWKNIPK